MTEIHDNASVLSRLGDDAYQAGFNGQAALLFSRGAVAALTQGNIRSHVHNLRWTGNALMWAGRFDEACDQLLTAISYEAHAEASIEDVYGAMTDLCLMMARRGPYVALQRMLTETRMFLSRRARESWAHRLDLTEAIAHLKREEYSDAYRLANRAWQQVRTVHDGPKYHSISYLNHIFHAAHGLRDTEAMDATLEQMQCQGEHQIQSCRVRQHLSRAIRLAFRGIREDNKEQISFHVEEAFGALSTSDTVGDEISHVLRLMGMLGRWEEANQRLARTSSVQRPGTELAQVDLALCRVAARAGWIVPYYGPHVAEAMPPSTLAGGEGDERAEILKLLEEATKFAGVEDARMNCNVHSNAVAMRRRWLLGNSPGDVGTVQTSNHGKAARP
jgi:hypothetical protein